MKTQILLITFFIITTAVVAQTNDQQARQKYQEAKETYENQEYIKTTQLLYEVEALLGKPNIRTQPLLIKALAQIPAWQIVKKEVARYKALKPDPSLVEYEEIMSIGKQVEENIKIENDAYKSIEANPSINDCNSYLSAYPYGIYRDEVNWLIAKVTNTTDSYYKYIDTYPNGTFIKKVTQQVHYWDSLWYDNALKKNTVEAFQNYLTNSPRGKHSIESQKFIDDLKEEESWQKALRGYNLDPYFSYLKNYPKGKFVKKARQKLHSSDSTMYAEAIQQGSIEAFENYLKYCPTGEYRRASQNKIEEIKELKAYRNTISTGNPTEYRKEYPNNRKEEMLALLEEYYYKRILETYEEKDYRECSEFATKYIYRLEFKKYLSKVRKLYKKSLDRYYSN